jgi:hypothetical protein
VESAAHLPHLAPQSRVAGADAFLADPRLRSTPFEAPLAPPLPGHALSLPPGGLRAPPHLRGLPPLCNKLKRLGATCLWVALKAAETCAPSCADIAKEARVPSFDRAQIILAERALLRTLNFSTLLPTAVVFAGAFLDAASSDGLLAGAGALSCASDLLKYLLDLCIIPVASIGVPPSLMGAAAASLALQRAGVRWGGSRLPELSGYPAAALTRPRGLLLAAARDAPRLGAAQLLPALWQKHGGQGPLAEMSSALGAMHAHADAPHWPPLA